MAAVVASPASFREQLEDARRPTHGAAHPWSVAWAEGRLTLRQMAQWAKQHYYYIDRVPQQFAQMFVRCDDLKQRHFILENLMGEEVQGERHPELLLRFAEACGMNRQEVLDADVNGEILPPTRGLRAWVEELVQAGILPKPPLASWSVWRASFRQCTRSTSRHVSGSA